MKEFLKSYWKTLLFFAVVGLVGGYAVGIYMLDNYPADIKQQVIDELNASGLANLPVDVALGVSNALTSLVYGVVLGAVGIFLGKKVGLWRDEISITQKPLVTSLVVALAGGLLMILPDLLFFCDYSQAIGDSYANKPNIVYLLASVLYGGVIEEVMLRLFWMSLIVFVLHKLFNGKNSAPTQAILVISNIVSALLFAAGHLPATFLLIGNDPLVIVRCFALNGGLGLLFGWLYRKYGLRYAMIAHAGCHVVSKLIWLLFI